MLVAILRERFQPFDRGCGIEVREALCREPRFVRQRPEHPPHEVILPCACGRVRQGVVHDDALLAEDAVTIGISPGCQSPVQHRVVMAATAHFVQDGRNPLGLPFDGLDVFLAGIAVAQRIGLRGDLAQHSVGGQRIHHVAQYWVIDAVADEANHVVAEQLADEACRPAFGQVGEAKVAAGEHQPVEHAVVRLVRQEPVQVDQPVPAAAFRDGKHRRCIGIEVLLGTLGGPFKHAVEVGRDEADGTLTGAGQL